jgi:hypothetical protein
METGTITLKKNSKDVLGLSTQFTVNFQYGDILFTTIEGIHYSLIVDQIESDTQLSLVTPYEGNDVENQSFSVIPRLAMAGLTAQLAADVARAIKGLNFDKANWQKVLTEDGEVTVQLPDGSQFKGPSWYSLYGLLEQKADKSALEQKADKSDLGEASLLDVGTIANTVAAGDDQRIIGALQKGSGGNVSGEIISTNPDNYRIRTNDRSFFFRYDGNDFYVMKTKAGDPDGGWDDDRPIRIGNDGAVYIEGVRVAQR